MARHNIKEPIKTIEDLQKIWDEILDDIQSYYDGNSNNLNLNELIEDFIQYIVLYETKITCSAESKELLDNDDSIPSNVKELFNAANEGQDVFLSYSASLFKNFNKQPDCKLSNINQDFFIKLSTYNFSYENTILSKKLTAIDKMRAKVANTLLVSMKDILIQIDNKNNQQNISSNFYSKIFFYCNHSLNFAKISSLCEAYPSARLDGFDPKNIDITDDSNMIKMLDQVMKIISTILTPSTEGSSASISSASNETLTTILMHLCQYDYLSSIYKENILEITNLSLEYFKAINRLNDNRILPFMLNTISNCDTQNMSLEKKLQFLDIKIRFMDMIEANTISVSPEMQQALIKSTLTTVGQVLAHESFVSSNADIQAYKEIFTAFDTAATNQTSLDHITNIKEDLKKLNQPSFITRVLMKICSWFISQKTIDKHNVQVDSMAKISQALQTSEKLLNPSNSIPTQENHINNSQKENPKNIEEQIPPTTANEQTTLSC